MVHAPASATPRLAVALAGAVAALVLVEQSAAVQQLLAPVFDALGHAVARATAWLLACLEMPVTREGTVLAHDDGFSYRIGYVCSGVRPAVLVAVAMLAAPATWRQRLGGFALALAGIAALNFVRLVHLYWLGVHHPDAFFVAHRVTWNVIAVAAVAAYLMAWLHWTADGRARRAGGPACE